MRAVPAEDLAAWRCLRQALGTLSALRIVAELQFAKLRGEPFAHLPRAAEAKEAGSRAQAGGAVLLYRAVRRRHGPEVAMRVTAEVVREAALVFLEAQIGHLGPDELAAHPPERGEAWVREGLDRFPNLTATLEQADPTAVRFTVHRCRLVELVREVGHPELAPVFCAADATFFGTSRPGLRLERPATLAAGDPHCRFHILPQEPR